MFRWPRGLRKFQKRYLITAVARNLGFTVRKLHGSGRRAVCSPRAGFRFSEVPVFILCEPSLALSVTEADRALAVHRSVPGFQENWCFFNGLLDLQYRS